MKTKDRVLKRENGDSVFGFEIEKENWKEEKNLKGASFRGFVKDSYNRVYVWIRKIDDNYFLEVKLDGIIF